MQNKIMSIMHSGHSIITLLLVVIIIAASCREQEHHQEQRLSFNYVQNDSLLNPGKKPVNVHIANPHDEKINIRFSYNQKFWFTKADLINSITSMETDDVLGLSPYAAKSWIFAMQNTYAGNNTHLPETSVQLPSVFLNSTGAGICDDRSYFLHKLWQLMGYKSRVWYLDGHVVPEVYDETWKMLDVHYNLYIISRDKEIQGVRELENSIDDFDLRFYQHGPSFLLLPAYYEREMYQQLFKTAANNTTEIPAAGKWKNSHITLPPHAELSFPYYPDSLYYQAIGKMHISGDYAGVIALPFTVHRIENATIAGINVRKPYNNLPAGKYFLSGNDCTIYFYVNPMLTASSENNRLQIKKDKNLLLLSELTPSQSFQNMEYFRFFRTFIPKTVHDNLTFFDNMGRIKRQYDSLTLHITDGQEFTDSIRAIYQYASGCQAVPDSLYHKLETLEKMISWQKLNTRSKILNTKALFYMTWSSVFVPEKEFRFLVSEHIAKN
ncbi:MAG: hypothetical protein ACP5DZ_04520 [Bacteroidales bacterium]